MDFVFDPSLVLYLPLYQPDGASLASKDIHGHPCTVTGATWTPQGRKFDGTDDLISIGSPSVVNPGTKGITVSYWICPLSTTGSYIGHVNLSSATMNSRFQTVFHDGNLQVYTKDSSWHNTGMTLGLNEWTFVTWTRAGGTLSLNLNGIDTGWSMAHTGSLGPMTAITVGRHANTLNGMMGEVWIYQRGLSPMESQRNYLATKWRYQ